MSSESVARIRGLVRGVLESEKNANNLVELLNYLQHEEPPIISAATEGVSEVYTHLIQKHHSWLVVTDQRKLQLVPTLAQGPKDDVIAKYRDWMRGSYSTCKERLLLLLHHQSPDAQLSSLSSLMALILAEGSAHITLHTYSFPNYTLHHITLRLLDNQIDTSSLIGQFQKTYLNYDDVRYYWMKNIASITSQVLEGKPLHLPSRRFVENVFSALKSLHQWMPEKDDNIISFWAGEPPTPDPFKRYSGSEKSGRREEEEEGEGVEEEQRLQLPKPKKSRSDVRCLNVRSAQKHRKQFSDAWLEFLKLPLTSTLHKRVLVSLHSDVMPHLTEPTLLIDFLTDSYDTGGVVSLLALNGLFILMHQYHLDYPHFYAKLYQLLHPSLFHVKYMSRFFSLMDTFLSSTHLPLYLVAAFAKKISRLSLSSPPQGVMVALVFIVNLLKRHPNCKVLLHRKSEQEVALVSDPFSMSEEDPSKCGALDSCLWEMKTLQCHYCPQVATLACQLLPSVSKRVEEKNTYLDTNEEELMDELTAKLQNGQTVPLNFTEPSFLWEN